MYSEQGAQNYKFVPENRYNKRIRNCWIITICVKTASMKLLPVYLTATGMISSKQKIPITLKDSEIASAAIKDFRKLFVSMLKGFLKLTEVDKIWHISSKSVQLLLETGQYAAFGTSFMIALATFRSISRNW
jgi:hypothetical protein